MKLAIVGSQAKSWDAEGAAMVRGVIVAYLRIFDPSEVISGRSPGGGVDQWAEDVANILGFPFTPFESLGKTWEHYKARNIDMAEYCSHMVCIRSGRSKTYGSGWTVDYAEKIGRPVWRFML